MALESVFAIAPPLVGEVNKDTQIEGEKESKEDDDGDLTEPAEDLEDLEEGEILDDSEGEVAADSAVKKDSCAEVTSEVKEQKEGAHDDDDDNTIEVTDNKKKKKKKKRKGSISEEPVITMVKKKKIKYIDHDRIDDDERDSWFDSYNTKYSRRDSRIDYSRELAEYRGSPYSSPERSPHGPFDSPDFSPDHRRSPSPYSTPSYGEDDYDEPEGRGRRTRQSVLRSRLGRKASSRGGKQKRISDSKKNRLRGSLSRGRKRDGKMRQLCKFFMENKCIKGSECPFSHACSPLRRKELCKFYLNGFCGKGEVCPFMHEEFPCKFYHTGSKCYSEKNCRFSHAPLNDEMRRVLDRHLESHKCDDDYMKNSADMEEKLPPNKHKRPSLLGSPPRHIKEAEETKRWQQEMQQMQQNKKGHYDRHFSSNKGILNSPPRYSKPNFYVDTMKSPVKSPSKKSLHSKPATFKLSQSTRFIKLSKESAKQLEADSSSQEEWPKKNRISMKPEEEEEECKENRSMIENDSIPVEEPEDSKQILVEKESCQSLELDTREMVELDSTAGELTIPESLETPNDGGDQPPLASQSQESGEGDSQSPPELEAPVVVQNPIAIPSHLPRKQRELFLRIQQHQKEAISGESGTDGGDISEDHDTKTEAEGKEERWYSSEEEEEDDDDDTEDQPLTAVLKKLQAVPPPAKSQTTTSATSSPAIDIAKMLDTIRQQVSHNPVSNGSTFNNQQNNFWQNILSGTVPPVANTNRPAVPFSTQVSGTNSESKDSIPRSNSDLRMQMFTSNEQTLPPPLSPAVTVTNRDPRMQNSDRTALRRDPRLQSRSLDPRITNVAREFQLPGLTTSSAISSLSSEPQGAHLQDKMREVLQNKTAVIVDGGKGIGNVPYKLRAVTVSQPNYTSYLIASQSDPKLLNDPRLRKHIHMKNAEVLHPHLPRQFPKDLLIPPLQMNNLPGENQQQSVSHLHETQITSGGSEPWQLPDIKLPPLRIADPRMTKIAMTDPRLARQQGSITPPHTNSSEVNWLPASTATPIISMTNAAPITTHLPRAITDPRLARLHHPIDPRRARHAADTTHQEQNSHFQSLGRRQTGVSNDMPHDVLSPREDFIRKQERTPIDVNIHPVNQNVTTSDSKDIVLPNQEKNDSESNDSEKPQKITSHNRKSSMDYASPLNTFDSNSTSNSGYNSYNRRPKPRIPSTTSPNVQTSIPDTSSSSPVTETSVVSSQELDLDQSAPFTSNEVPVPVADSVDVASSLKDMFKTIDPTASPFC